MDKRILELEHIEVKEYDEDTQDIVLIYDKFIKFEKKHLITGKLIDIKEDKIYIKVYDEKMI